MDPSVQYLYDVFLEREIIVGEEVQRIFHSQSWSLGRTLEEEFQLFNRCLKNEGLLTIKTRDEETDLSYYMLSKLGRLPEECWKDLKTGNSNWSDTEKSNLRKIANQIMGLKQKCVKVGDPHSLQKLSRLIEFKWLNYCKETDTASLGPRFLGQMRRWIRDQNDDVDRLCHFCHVVVLRGSFCVCGFQCYHDGCFKKIPDLVKCNVCDTTPRSLKVLEDHQQRKHKSQQQQQQNRGLIGLPNVGRSCFLNSIVQILTNNEQVRQIFLSDRTFQSGLSINFAYLMEEAWNSTRSCVSRDILQTIINNFPQLKGAQQDPHEFLRLLLAKFEDEKVEEIFRGRLRSTTQCEKCKHETATRDYFLDLCLPIPVSMPLVTLERCIDLLFQPTHLKGRERATCYKCRTLQNAQREFIITKIPETLTLQLNRFRREKSRTVKNQTRVKFPANLDLGRWTLDGSGSFRLVGIVCHEGSSVNSGHCTSYTFNKTRSSWIKCDDENVALVDVKTVICDSTFRNAYILFYDKQ